LQIEVLTIRCLDVKTGWQLGAVHFPGDYQFARDLRSTTPSIPFPQHGATVAGFHVLGFVIELESSDESRLVYIFLQQDQVVTTILERRLVALQVDCSGLSRGRLRILLNTHLVGISGYSLDFMVACARPGNRDAVTVVATSATFPRVFLARIFLDMHPPEDIEMYVWKYVLPNGFTRMVYVSISALSFTSA
jgi:hypothetical protein